MMEPNLGTWCVHTFAANSWLPGSNLSRMRGPGFSSLDADSFCWR
jgi:hypothetical protein